MPAKDEYLSVIEKGEISKEDFEQLGFLKEGIEVKTSPQFLPSETHKVVSSKLKQEYLIVNEYQLVAAAGQEKETHDIKIIKQFKTDKADEDFSPLKHEFKRVLGAFGGTSEGKLYLFDHEFMQEVKFVDAPEAVL